MSPEELIILIVDDEIGVTMVLSDYLSTKGYKTIAVHTARDALEAMKSQRPSAVLLDVVLPDLNGIEVLKVIRRLYPDVAVVVMSGLATEEMAKEAMKLGAYDYLPKPIDLVYLERVMELIELYHLTES